MAVIYTSVTQRFNKILFRGYSDGKRIQSADSKFEPSLFEPTDEDTGIKSLYGLNLREIPFDSISEAKQYVKTYKSVNNIHGNDRYEYDFIHRNFTGEQAVTINDLTVLSTDIETTVEFGFPDVFNPEEEVLLITCQDIKTKALTTFGCRPYSGSDTNYILCKDEPDLLSKFINFIIDVDPDIITGWNVIRFDVAYLFSRIIKILGQRALNRISPFGIVDRKIDTVMDQELLRYDIIGRVVLDLLELYKKFRFKARPNYKLGSIGQVEIGETKLKFEGSFKEHYTNNWDGTAEECGFVSYNIRDVVLVSKLEAKLGLVYLAVVLAYLTKVNFDDVFSPVKTWESYILSTLYEENIFCELKQIDSSDDSSIVGGFVKDVIPGLYDWTVGFDATSLYPSIIMSNNMSPETFHDMVEMPDIDEMLAGKLPIVDSEYTLCVNGARFRRDIVGVMTRLTEHVFDSRKSAKRKMLDLKNEYEKTHEQKTKLESDRYGVLQLALKVQANALFGVCSNKYFLFFDNRIAEGITKTGQYIIQITAAALNAYMSTLTGENSDKIIAMDTDSAYVHFGPLIRKYFPKVTDEQKIVDAIIKITEQKIDPILNATTNKISTDLNFYKNKIYFKLEAISSNSIFLAKKRNAQRVLDNEGVRYSEPDIKITGIETQRSSTPDLVREWLTEAIRIVLDHSNRELLVQYIERRRSDFRSYSVEDIAFPRSVNNIVKFTDHEKIYAKGTPIAVRAALLYNNLVHKNKLEKELELIKEGQKILYIAMKEPNTLHEDIVGFPMELPKQFNLHRYVDYDTQFQKAFLDPLMKIMNALQWELEDSNDLDSFF